jgi:hypothetical protein
MIHTPWGIIIKLPAMDDTHFDIENSSGQKYRRRLHNLSLFWILPVAGEASLPDAKDEESAFLERRGRLSKSH